MKNKNLWKKILLIVVIIAAVWFLNKIGIIDLASLLGGGSNESYQELSLVDPESTPESSTESKNESKNESQTQSNKVTLNGVTVTKGKSYYSKNEVALYIHAFGELPPNFITKKEAEKLGWEGGSLEKYAPGKAIGGSTFGNSEGLLPKAKGRTWKECDIDTKGAKSRGAKRIVFSNDGLIYYTDDHYESFTLLFNKDGAVK